MKTVSWLVAVSLGISSCLGAEESWTGKISDSKCGARHKMKSAHSAGKVSDADCTAACVKDGAKYVFASNGKVYKIENQDFTGLQKYAGQTVRLTGEMTGAAITVSNITAVKEHKGEKSTL
jgi:hypothetical protein